MPDANNAKVYNKYVLKTKTRNKKKQLNNQN